MPNESPNTTILQELRWGVIILAVLAVLQEKKYGYAILKQLGESGLEIDPGTLYPMLRRLESQGLLESHWDLESARPRRYYRISDAGRTALADLRQHWQQIVGRMQPLLDGKTDSHRLNDTRPA